jgi:predicted aldo/keto reductase-like oxidoreductase
MTQEKSRKTISRRTFLKGLGAAAAGGAAYQVFKGFRSAGGDDLPETKEAMTLRTNPLNGDKVSLLGFGCMRLPMIPGSQSPNGPEIDEPAAERLIDYAYARGVNYFDTAWPYHGGRSEVVMGQALQKYPRDSFYIADKMPTFLNPDRAKAEEYFFTQLKRCQTEYFDYYLLHSLMTKDSYVRVYEEEGVLDFLQAQKKAGRIRSLGWSFHGDEETLDYILSSGREWDVFMVQYNYHDLLHDYVVPDGIRQRLTREAAPPKMVLEKAGGRGIPLIIMEPLLGGRLARLSRKAVAILQTEHPDRSPASWAFRYTGGLPNVLTVLSGMTLLEHVKDNLRTHCPFEPLTDPETAVLKKALDVFITQENIPCTACGYCLPCPYDVNIPAVFTHYNMCVDEEYIPRGVRSEDYEKARRAYLVGYDRSVPELQQASHCTGCGVCLEHCPQGIAISAELARLSKFAEDLRNQPV